jgi:hypothetical protein
LDDAGHAYFVDLVGFYQVEADNGVILVVAGPG